jgi:hypothetical protein
MLAPTGERPIIGEGEALKLLVSHGSTEGGEFGDRLIMVAVTVGAC